MSDRDEKLLRRLLPIFREEARERIASLAARMRELGAASGEGYAAIVEIMFREAHSLKAAARTVGRTEIELICQTMEGAFAEVKRDKTVLSHARHAALSGAVEVLEDIAATIDAVPSEDQRARAIAVTNALQAALKSAPTSRSPAPILAPAPAPAPGETAAPAAEETVRLSIALLNELLLQTEEMLAEKLAAHRLATELAALSAAFAVWKKEWRDARAALPHVLSRLAERADGDPTHRGMRPALKFLEMTDPHFGAFETIIGAAQKAAKSQAHSLGLKVDRLLGTTKQILKIPCASLLQAFPGVVRNLARDQGKEVALVIRGADLEVDRRILQELMDPLLHLLRNGIDHGIETPQERRAAGKDARAAIALSVAARDGDKVEFAIADDGAGIATDRLIAAARKMELLGPGRGTPSAAELLPLIFQSGVSTKAAVSDLSGRGLGLAIVREKVERLGGTVGVESTPGRGTIFRLVLPLTLAMYRGIAVRVADRTFVLPTFSTDRVLRVRREAVLTIDDRPTIKIGDAAVPLVRLGEVLELPGAPAGRAESDWLVLVLLGEGALRVAFAVDDVEGDQEILLKPLGKCLVRVRNVLGAAILPAGQIAPVLNVQDLLKSAAKMAGSARPAAVTRASASKSVLIAEDSITARGLLKSMLEAAGYDIRTACDGMEAWAMLQAEPVDLIVSDIEMPRMNGYELTARIRRDKKLTTLPVVLVTALGSRADFARGIDVGANACFSKGHFERERLLDAIEGLLR